MAYIQNEDKSLAILNNEKDSENSILSKYTALKASYQATIEILNKTINDNNAQILKLEQETVYIIGDKNKISAKLDVISKFITVSNRDFRGYLLKNVISYFDKKA